MPQAAGRVSVTRGSRTIDQVVPIKPGGGPACGIALKDGQYASGASGPLVGKNRVEIRAPHSSGRAQEGGDWKSGYAESIPARVVSHGMPRA